MRKVLQVRLERVSHGLRSYEFAQLIGCDPERWYKFENGTKRAPADIAAKASELLGKPASELFAPVEAEPVGV